MADSSLVPPEEGCGAYPAVPQTVNITIEPKPAARLTR